MTNEAELQELFRQKSEEESLLSRAHTCQTFKASPMYALLDTMMEALEDEALAKLQAFDGSNKDDLLADMLRWQERRKFRQSIKNEIDANIADAAELVSSKGIDIDAYLIRSDIEH